MKVTPAIVQQEFIGLYAKVVRSSNPGYLGIEGKVLGETRNTFLILNKNKKRTVVKNTSVLSFAMPDGTIVEIDGKAIVGRPEVRVKKGARRLW